MGKLLIHDARTHGHKTVYTKLSPHLAIFIIPSVLSEVNVSISDYTVSKDRTISERRTVECRLRFLWMSGTVSKCLPFSLILNLRNKVKSQGTKSSE